MLYLFWAPRLREKLQIKALPPLNSHAEYEPKVKGAWCGCANINIGGFTAYLVLFAWVFEFSDSFWGSFLFWLDQNSMFDGIKAVNYDSEEINTLQLSVISAFF